MRCNKPAEECKCQPLHLVVEKFLLTKTLKKLYAKRYISHDEVIRDGKMDRPTVIDLKDFMEAFSFLADEKDGAHGSPKTILKKPFSPKEEKEKP